MVYTVFAAVGVYHMFQHIVKASQYRQDGRFFCAVLGTFFWPIFCAMMASFSS